jgi:hypothetical protein
MQGQLYNFLVLALKAAVSLHIVTQSETFEYEYVERHASPQTCGSSEASERRTLALE